MPTQHVIFGTGPLGQAVMRALLKRDDAPIRMVNRSGNRRDIPDSVEVVASDAYDVEQVKQVTQGAAVVYQCAQPGYTEWPEKFPPLQAAILEGTAVNGAKLIIGDNLYGYGDTDGQPIHEDSPQMATGDKGRTRAQMAQTALAAHESGKVRVALARGSDFFGEGVLGSLCGERAIGFLMAGKPASFLAGIDQPHTQTYIGDFGEALVILGERDEALGKAWHVPNAEPTLTTREFMQRVADQLGVELKVSVMPRLMFEAVSRVHPMVREFRELRYEFDKPYIVDHSRFVATFGNLATPLDVAIANTLAWYEQHLAILA